MEKEICPICLENITSRELYITSCAHKFHNNCFQEFLKKTSHNICPICRTELHNIDNEKEHYFFNLNRFDEHVRRMENEQVNARRREDGRRYLHSFANILQNVNIEPITEALHRSNQIESSTEDILNTFGPTILYTIGQMFMQGNF